MNKQRSPLGVGPPHDPHVLRQTTSLTLWPPSTVLVPSHLPWLFHVLQQLGHTARPLGVVAKSLQPVRDRNSQLADNRAEC